MTGELTGVSYDRFEHTGAIVEFSLYGAVSYGVAQLGSSLPQEFC